MIVVQFIICDLCIISPPIYKHYLITGAKTQEILITSVKGGYVLVVLVCLSVHLSIGKITYKVMNRFACMNLLSEVHLRSINDL